MEALQCDGCDYRAETYDDLKAHIQDVHTVFLPHVEASEEDIGQPRSLTPTLDSEADISSLPTVKTELGSPVETPAQNSYQPGSSNFITNSSVLYSHHVNQHPKPANKFFQCKYCVRYFRSRSLLGEHTRKIHGQIEGPLFGGESSDMAPPPSPSSFHVLLHEGFGKVFACRYCTYKSPRRARIIKHQKLCHRSTMKVQDQLGDVPVDAVERSILEAQVKPLTKSRGSFCCEWCGYHTSRRERWCDHLMKKHRNLLAQGLVKIISSLRQQQSGSSPSQTKSQQSDSEKTSPNSNYLPLTAGGGEMPCAQYQAMKGSMEGSPSKQSPTSTPRFAPIKIKFPFQKTKPKAVPDPDDAALTDRPSFGMADLSLPNSSLETSSLLSDDRSSSDEEEQLDMDEMDSLASQGSEGSGKKLLSIGNTKLLETKGIPFRKYMNRFQCPFCSFLTMHRRSISRHIENIHLSGRTIVHKCNLCSFTCTTAQKLAAHKQCHSSEWETVSSANSSAVTLNDSLVTVDVNQNQTVNGEKPAAMCDSKQQYPYKCTMCSYSTVTLKGLRVHQQHKHSFCDNALLAASEEMGDALQDSGSQFEALPSPGIVKTQTSILGSTSKNSFLFKKGKRLASDSPLDLSPAKKRTRIDEIANNLQSKISQANQQASEVGSVIAVEDAEEEGDDEEEEDEEEDEEEEDDVELDADGELEEEEGKLDHLMDMQNYSYSGHQMWVEGTEGLHKDAVYGSVDQDYSVSNSAEIELTLSDDEDYYGTSNAAGHCDGAPRKLGGNGTYKKGNSENRDGYQEGSETGEDSGKTYSCKHCNFSNKVARSVSTHYQRMHPYIKYSFRYIEDPTDHSAVYRCLECFVEYAEFEDLRQHYAQFHPEAQNILNFHQANLIYRCRFCSYTSPNVRSLMPHYQRMHPTVKINNSMIFSSYVVQQTSESNAESQTLREILNSGVKSIGTPSSVPNLDAPTSPPNIKPPKSMSPQEGESSMISAVVYSCDVCPFSSPNMHSVLVHYQRKHPEEKASYFRIQKTMRVVSVLNPAINAQNITEACPVTPPSNPPVAAQPAEFEQLYYCKHCVYSNRSVVGVLVHYQKRHPEVKVTAKYIKQAPPTPALRKTMEELQITPARPIMTQPTSQAGKKSYETVVNISSQQRVTDKGEGEMMFFCQHCNYGNRTVKGVVIHYRKKHRDIKATAELVRQHTAAVRSQRERATNHHGGGASTPLPSVQPEAEVEQLRFFKCRHCSYTAHYLYAVRKHLKKQHPSVKATVTTILRWAYQDGVVTAGYHCEWCIYSHQEPSGLLIHYQKRHPEHPVDYTYISSKLWAGPDPSANPSQIALIDLKHYKCRDCEFEAASIWDITNHYQALHPWAVSGDESVLLDIILGKDTLEQNNPTAHDYTAFDSLNASESSQLEDELPLKVSMPSLLREPPVTPAPSSSPYQCKVCKSEYNNLHGLLTHYGKKHPGVKVKAAEFALEKDEKPSTLYKCRHCPYVNTRIHGVLTHYQKRHPTIKVTADDFMNEAEKLPDGQSTDLEEMIKVPKQGFGAYRCKLCPYAHGSLEKLKVHYEKYHRQPAIDIFTESATETMEPQQPDASEEYRDDAAPITEVNPRPPSPTPQHFVSGCAELSTLFKCQLCKYFCSSRKGIARHYRNKHNNVRAQPEGKNNIFRCALCAYTHPLRKGLAAHYQKRHDIDSYYTHCLAASKTIITKKPEKLILPIETKPESPPLSEELRRAVEKKKCSLCSFQTYTKKGLVSHYMKRHPGVYPRKQYVSKYNGYFTVVYSDDKADEEVKEEVTNIETVAVVEGKPKGWLPFKCIKCFQLSFNTAELLCMHYVDHHSRELKLDFTLLPGSTRSHSPTYECNHCNDKILSTLELSVHLTRHNERLGRRARLHREKMAPQGENRPDGESQPKSEPQSEGEVQAEVVPPPEGEVQPEGEPPAEVQMQPAEEEEKVKEENLNEEILKDENQNQEENLKEEGPESTALEDSNKKQSADVQASSPVSMDKERNVVGYKCSFCFEVHPTPRAISNHLRKHVAFGESLDTVRTGEEKDGETTSVSSAEKLSEDLPGGVHKPQSLEVEEDATGVDATLGGYPCSQCDRILMSLQGLRSHERSHTASALFSREGKHHCQYCLFATAFRQNLERHMQNQHGHQKPFRCKLCSFKTAFISGLKSHIQRAHADPTFLKCPSIRSKDSSYSEPPDVQQQLNHYQTAAMARNRSSPILVPSPTAPSDQMSKGYFSCEFCQFNSEYIQSMRRHYRDRHCGKKLYKCKDCPFFTGFRSTFSMHVEGSHTAPPVEGPKDLRCPLCLYHTKYKSSMIDHIVLHREERVVPIEVCRSKLSRHLRGIVFRCDKCTFTSSSDETLQQHMEKHKEMKPYKCQLCYYESRIKEDLENHLQEEHKVIRNFELVGRVNLDQLDFKDKEWFSSEEEAREEEKGHIVEQRGIEVCPGSGARIYNEKRFPCEFCGRTFARGFDWERHIQRHSMALGENNHQEHETCPATENSREENNTTPLRMEEQLDSADNMKTEVTYQEAPSCPISLALIKENSQDLDTETKNKESELC
ncbi:zinc finger protein 462 isoform X2 [Leucoraja erinacea]|uniref:zinc finger protein 462 isoform X2 n=1 Tax=Leucoraja erinaceus TaxID=7782 RepID=UPI002458DEB9|nr:zinc finger protein 462 isoform X2 [Leucoraja erinacea]